ncbi:LysR family transcriptional regulator [Salinicola halophilus]|uniref:LysR family transcriptional regulator n=1 Tax=Salinicola halophilus TaxID=184065 RepID=UPI0013A60161|nr:LysR family transcriptional regulator [Salinicola halophilus]
MNLNHLRIFVSVAEQGSILAASKALGVPKSTVARQLAQFETELAQPLVLRNTRHLRLTPSGRRLYERAHCLIAALEELENDLGESDDALSGKLTVAIPSEFAVRWLNDGVAAFVAAHPGVALDCVTSMAPLDPVKRDVDVSISYHRGKLADSAMVVRSLVTMESVVVAAPSVIAEHGRPGSIHELTTLPCLSTLTALEANPWHFLDASGQAISLKVPARYRVDSSTLLIAGARAGIGFAIIPRHFCQPWIDAGELLEIALDLTPAPLEIIAIHPDRHGITARARAFVDLVQSRLRQEPGLI